MHLKHPQFRITNHALIICFLFLYNNTLLSQTEKPQTLILPTLTIGKIAEARKIILEKTFESKLDDYFDVVQNELLEEAQEKAFQKLDYEECTEDQCVMMIKEMLQVENAFHLLLIFEGGDTQVSITWNDLYKKRVEEEYCVACETKELRIVIRDLVEKLTNFKKIDPLVVDKINADSKAEIPEAVSNNNLDTGTQHKEERGKDLFVTVGKKGKIFTSLNGNTWTLRKSSTKESLTSVIYGKGIYVVVGDDGTILTSRDGILWELNVQGKGLNFRSITYGKGLFVTVSSNGLISTSSDGSFWIPVKSEVNSYLGSITYGNELFVTVGYSGTILTSSDGRTWKKRKSQTNNHLMGITYGNGVFMAVGFAGTVLTSSDGIYWTLKNSGTTEHLLDVTFGENLFVAVGYTKTIITSSDGSSWMSRSPIDVTFNLLRKVTYGNDMFITVGISSILISYDGLEWRLKNKGIDDHLVGLTYSK